LDASLKFTLLEIHAHRAGIQKGTDIVNVQKMLAQFVLKYGLNRMILTGENNCGGIASAVF